MEIEQTDRERGITVLRLEGRLNMVSAPRLKAVIDEAVASGHPRVVIDLAAVTFMDSSGLGTLIAGLKKARQADGDVRITGVTQQVATVLALTNLDRVLRAHPTVEAATDGW